MAISLTKVAGRHTFKGGFYNNHSFKAQNVGAGGIANLSFQGYVNFGNDTNNALDSGFGYSNAALGVYSQYLQASKFVEGSMLYNNTEGYIQDNWKVNSRLTLDYGLRLTHQQPQYDQFQQMSNFFPDQWSASPGAVPLCSRMHRRLACSGNNLNAMDPRNGQILTAPGLPIRRQPSERRSPGSGNAASNGIVQAGNGISKYGYTWPKIVMDLGSVRPTTSAATRAWCSAAAPVSSTTVRTGIRCSRFPATRQSPHRQTFGMAISRVWASGRIGVRPGASDGHLPVRCEGPGVGSVAGRLPEDTSVVVGGRRLLRR